MQITFLGTGTSQGVPVIACQCKVCKSTDHKDKRLRTSLLVNVNDLSLVIDTGPDFRQQMLDNNVEDVSAVLFTHEHRDHTGGLDDIRPFNFIRNAAMDVYAEERVLQSLRKEYYYIFEDGKYPGIPQIHLNEISVDPINIQGETIIPIRAYHHILPVLGYRIGNMGYLTDIKTIEQKELDKLQGVDLLIVNALRIDPHISHMNLEEALDVIRKVRPGKAYLTHISHLFELKHSEIEELLPEGVFLAYDGLKIDL